MRISSILCFVTASALAAGAANANDYSINGIAKKMMTYQSVPDIGAAKTTGYSGVGTLFVSVASTATTGLGYLCTGSLLNSRAVLTAAHCLYNYDESGNYDPVTSVNFFLPSAGDYLNGDPVEVFSAGAWAYNPGYDTADHLGDIGSGNDVGMLALSQNAHGYDTYGLYTGDPLQTYTEVGTGTVGGPDGTDGSLTDYLKRVGTNTYELYGNQLFSDVTSGVVLSDFDNGKAQNDVFGRNLGLVDTGLPGESGSSPGDSGGPSFINGQIAAVTSFGITGGIFQGYCGADSTDPYDVSRSSALQTNLSLCTNSSVGEINGNTLVSYNLGFIKGFVSQHPVPEPASWIQMIAGFALLGGALRGRRKLAWVPAIA